MTHNGLETMLSVFDGKINNTDAYQALVAMEQSTKFGESVSSAWETDYFVSKSGRSYDYMKISGTLVPRTGSMRPYCGMIPTIRLAEIIQGCEADALILHWDSGGGATMGTPELAEAIFSLRAKGVEVISFTDTQMASAAYWAGSAASSVICSQSAIVGSIGVYATVTKAVDSTNQTQKTTIYRAGGKKAFGHPNLPMSAEEEERIQSMVSETYVNFTSAVAKYRDVDASLIVGTEADFFTGSNAPSFLVDGVMTLTELITKAKES